MTNILDHKIDPLYCQSTALLLDYAMKIIILYQKNRKVYLLENNNSKYNEFHLFDYVEIHNFQV